MDKNYFFIFLTRIGLITALLLPSFVLASEKQITEKFQSKSDIITKLAPGQRKYYSFSFRQAIDLEINFELNSHKLSNTALKQLDALGLALNDPKLQNKSFTIAGHTDASGSAKKNKALSEKRAQAVMFFLIKTYKLKRDRLTAIGYGATRLKNILEPRSKTNRRVEIRVNQNNASEPSNRKMKW